MNITSQTFLNTLPAFFSQGKAKLPEMVIHAKLYHPELPYEYYILEYDKLQQLFMAFVVSKEDDDYKFFTIKTLGELLTNHEVSYIAEDGFTPVKLVELFPNYVVPAKEEDVFC